MNMESDVQDAKIVHSTIDLAHNLGLTVVAEGIEEGCFRKDLKPTEVCISWAGMVAYYYLMNEIKKRFSVKEEITEDSYMHQAFDVLMNGIKNKEIG